jgi:hypothetical protein
MSFQNMGKYLQEYTAWIPGDSNHHSYHHKNVKSHMALHGPQSGNEYLWSLSREDIQLKLLIFWEFLGFLSFFFIISIKFFPEADNTVSAAVWPISHGAFPTYVTGQDGSDVSASHRIWEVSCSHLEWDTG